MSIIISMNKTSPNFWSLDYWNFILHIYCKDHNYQGGGLLSVDSRITCEIYTLVDMEAVQLLLYPYHCVGSSYFSIHMPILSVQHVHSNIGDSFGDCTNYQTITLLKHHLCYNQWLSHNRIICILLIKVRNCHLKFYSN